MHKFFWLRVVFKTRVVLCFRIGFAGLACVVLKPYYADLQKHDLGDNVQGNHPPREEPCDGGFGFTSHSCMGEAKEKSGISTSVSQKTFGRLQAAGGKLFGLIELFDVITCLALARILYIITKTVLTVKLFGGSIAVGMKMK